ncbi:hypothetical protein AR543_02780 [Paenibacillus bovis]|uniref:Uncharacterized protein n=1 Tax=Paenibacillus bovis TaxID=1616788 RepID=A0A172ZCT1_9BACL|nr:hypothetical protein AR543_02780 [Paenibacillus bovis]
MMYALYRRKGNVCKRTRRYLMNEMKVLLESYPLWITFCLIPIVNGKSKQRRIYTDKRQRKELFYSDLFAKLLRRIWL